MSTDRGMCVFTHAHVRQHTHVHVHSPVRAHVHVDVHVDCIFNVHHTLYMIHDELRITHTRVHVQMNTNLISAKLDTRL